MRLNSISLHGVKGFVTEQTLPIVDINLLYGANSSGKSTLVQSILLLKQSSNAAFAPGAGVLEFNGEEIDLGSYATFVSGHCSDTAMTFEMNFDDGERNPFFDPSLTLRVTFRHDEAEPGGATVDSCTIGDSKTVANFRVDDGRLHLDDAASAKALVGAFFSYVDQSRFASRDYAAADEGDRRWLQQWLKRQELELIGWIPRWPMGLIDPNRPGRPLGGSRDSIRNKIVQTFAIWWHEYAARLAFEIYDCFQRIVYVGPLRDFPQRIVRDADQSLGVGSRGENLIPHLLRNPDLVCAVNSAFETLEIPYKLDVQRLTSDNLQSSIGSVGVALLTDTRTGVGASPADVGFGLSQVLPVIVQLGANTDSLIIVEQPEIHLHPRIQARLANVILASVMDNRNTVLIETHSEHLLTRMEQLLQARATSGAIPHLAVRFVNQGDRGSEILDLRVGPDGSVLDPWPGGFFDDPLWDVIGGGN